MDWVLAGCNFRGNFTGQYAINGETLSTITTRLTGTGGGTQVNILSDTAGTAIVLCGVNEGATDISVTGPKYHNIVDGLLGAGFVVFLLNELPNGNFSGQGPDHFARRTYLDNYVPADATKASFLVKVNSYDLLAVSPTSYDWAAGYHEVADTVPFHPNQRANIVLGRFIGSKMELMYAGANMNSRSKLPLLNGAETGFAVSDQFNGTGGTIGSGASGTMATNWAGDAIPAGLAVAYSKTIDPDGFEQLTVTVSGTATTPSSGTTGGCNWGIHNNTNGLPGASGDVLAGEVRAILAAGSAGVSGIGLRIDTADITNSVLQNALSFTADGYSSDTYAQRIGAGYPSTALDITMMTPNLTLGAGWTAASSKNYDLSVQLWFKVGVAVNAVIKLSRAGIKIN